MCINKYAIHHKTWQLELHTPRTARRVLKWFMRQSQDAPLHSMHSATFKYINKQMIKILKAASRVPKRHCCAACTLHAVIQACLPHAPRTVTQVCLPHTPRTVPQADRSHTPRTAHRHWHRYAYPTLYAQRQYWHTFRRPHTLHTQCQYWHE